MSDSAAKEIEVLVQADPQRPGQKERPRGQWLKLVIILAVVLGILFFEISFRRRDEADLRSVNAEMAVPSVSVVQPKRAAPAQEIILPGNIQPFISSPIYARTDGYLKKWYFDIGARV